MDRRAFGKALIAGAALAAVPRVLAQSSTEAIFERARAALDRMRYQFVLRDRIAIADFTPHSREMRFHIIDLIGGQRFSYLCAHGKGSDPEHTGFLQRFSNENGSLATSRGTYMTGPVYFGVHGRAARLIGLEPDNYNADPRAIVMHGAPYVGENHIASWGKIGRSEGCFVFAPHRLSEVLALLGPGRMLYADKL